MVTEEQLVINRDRSAINSAHKNYSSFKFAFKKIYSLLAKIEKESFLPGLEGLTVDRAESVQEFYRFMSRVQRDEQGQIIRKTAKDYIVDYITRGKPTYKIPGGMTVKSSQLAELLPFPDHLLRELDEVFNELEADLNRVFSTHKNEIFYELKMDDNSDFYVPESFFNDLEEQYTTYATNSQAEIYERFMRVIDNLKWLQENTNLSDPREKIDFYNQKFSFDVKHLQSIKIR